MADKAQDPALTQPQDSCAPRATLPSQHRSPPTQYSPENTCSIHPRAYTCNPTYVYTHVHTPAQPQPQPPSCYGDVSHGYGRLQGTGQPRNPQVPPTEEGPPGITCRRERTAHSSKVSAASSLPWRRYRAPRFLRVVFTVGLREQTQGERGSPGGTSPTPKLPTKNPSYLLTLQALYQPPYSA